MKRGRGSDLTGGTGDVNPQIYNVPITQAGNDLTEIAQVPVPVYRFPLSKGKAMVMECLNVTWVLRDIIVGAAQGSVVAGISTTGVKGLTDGAADTAGNQYTALQQPTVFGAMSLDFLFATAVGFAVNTRIFHQDLTDAAGHGLLVATDKLFVFLASVGTVNSNEVTLKLAYRWKDVSLEEYIGIVQAQTSS